MALYDNVIDLIGNTPTVDISPLSPNPGVRIYAKLEGQNPGGSVKDRAAKYMIEAAELTGQPLLAAESAGAAPVGDRRR